MARKKHQTRPYKRKTVTISINGNLYNDIFDFLMEAKTFSSVSSFVEKAAKDKLNKKGIA